MSQTLNDKQGINSSHYYSVYPSPIPLVPKVLLLLSQTPLKMSLALTSNGIPDLVFMILWTWVGRIL